MSGAADQAAAGGPGPGDAPPAVPATTGPYIVALVRAVSEKWTGTIVSHTDDGLIHYSYFFQGAPCKVRPGVLVAPLDSILLRLGGIEPHALANAVSTACERPDLLLGEILIQRGLLTHDVLYSALRWQVLERLNYLMTEGVAGGRHDLYADVDLIPLASRAELHPADPMYCIMCAARLPACEPIAQRYIERVRQMRLGLTGDVDVARFGLTEDEYAVVQRLSTGALAFDELVEQGLPRAAVQRVIFALGVTQALASKGRFQSRSATMPVPPPSIPAPSGAPPVSAAVPAGGAEAVDGSPASSTSPGSDPTSGRRRTQSVGRIQLQQRVVRRSSLPPMASQPPSSRSPNRQVDSFSPAHSMPPPNAYGASAEPPPSDAAHAAPFIPAPRAPRRRRVRPSPAMPPSMPSALPPPAGTAPAPAAPTPHLTASNPEPAPAPAPPEPPPPRINPMLSEPFGFDDAVPAEVKAALGDTREPTPPSPVGPAPIAFDDPADVYDRDPESARPAPDPFASEAPPFEAGPEYDEVHPYPEDHGAPPDGGYDQPAYDEPVYEAPAYDQGAYQEPAHDQSAYDEPVYEEPAYDQGAYEEPAYEEPAHEEAPPSGDATDEMAMDGHLDEPEAPLATAPVRKRGLSLSERRAIEAQHAADASMRILDFRAANGHLQRALRFAPKNPDVMAKVAYVHAMNRGRRPAGDKEFYDEELGMLRDVIQEHPRCETAFYLRGRLLARLMRRDEAVRDFEKAVRINPDNVDAAREVREHEARMRKKRKRQEPPPEPTSSFRGMLRKLGIDTD